MKKAAPKKARPAQPAPQPFGEGLVEEAPQALDRPARDKKITSRGIERRLFQLLDPLIRQAGGFVATLEEVGEGGLYGLALTFQNDQSFDLIIREHSK